MQLKSLTPENLDHVIESLKPFYGFRFQEVQMSEQDLLIGLWGQGDLHWLFFDMQPQRPLVFLLPDPSPVKIKAQKKPLQLFLSAHAVGLTFIKAERKENEGRIIRLYFQSPKNPEFACEIEARLFPHGQNIIVQSKGKTISFEKVQELPPQTKSQEDLSSPTKVQDKTPSQSSEQTINHADQQSLDEAFSAWLAQRMPKSKQADNKNVELQKQKLLDKKQKAIAKVEQELQDKGDNLYQSLGNWLKINQSLQVPPKFQDLIDKKKSFAFNMEEAFRKSKQQKEKVQRTRERLAQLQEELMQIEHNQQPEKPTQLKKSANPDYKGRLLKLDENLEARTGKSGADNLKILRQARAWDFWLHLKDLPGSHAILFRNKNQKVADEHFRKVALWLIELSLKNKAPAKGEKYEILITECRFVRPIKGDKLGRVNYQNERVLNVVVR